MYIYTYTHAKKNIDGIIYLGMSEIYNIMSENNIQAYTILYIVYLGHVWKKVCESSGFPDLLLVP